VNTYRATYRATPRVVCLTLLVLALLSASAPAPPAVRAAEPLTFQGHLRYTEIGPGASGDGIGTAFLIGGIGAPVAAARLMTGLQTVLSLPGVADNPSMQSISQLLNSGVPIDLASVIPGSAHYTANVMFTIEEGDDGALHLKEGTLHWMGANELELSYEGGSITDKFGGSGSYTLDPSKDQIDLVFDRSADPMTLELTVSISHPAPTSGASEWNALGGAVTIRLESHNGHQRMSGQAMGQPIPPTESTAIYEHGIYYTRKGTLADLRGSETWRNLLDAQVFVEWELVDACSAWLETPAQNDEFTYKDDAAGTLEVEAQASVSPKAWGDDLEWTFPELDGSALTADPEDRRGPEVTFTYKGLPKDNAAFGRNRVSAAFRELADRCEQPPERTVTFFWDLDAENNPDGSVPNWFYYWKQTCAAQGHGDSIRYDPNCTKAWGYFDGYDYPSKANVIYLCPWGEGPFKSTNDYTGKVVEGIDHYASTVLHEWTHLENYHDWWPKGYDRSKDADRDLVPDDREAAYGMNPTMKDTYGLGFRDCEVPAYLQEHTWINGTCNHEDWSDPGKQSGGS
jgi:hypothetical protein